jgi:hypothetical protein
MCGFSILVSYSLPYLIRELVMKKLSILLLLFVSTFLFILFINGCATIFGWGGSEEVNVRSNPDQAILTITDESGTKVFEGNTPTIVSLEKKKGYFSGKTYTLIISKEGYTDKTISIDTKANGWYLGGNLIFGGLIGWLIVDPLTGAMWTFDNNEVDVTLESQKEGSLESSNQVKVVLLKDVPESLRAKMIPVNK